MTCNICRSSPATKQPGSGRTLCAGCVFQEIVNEAASRDLEERIQPAVLEWRDEWLGRGLTLAELTRVVARLDMFSTGEMLLAARPGFRVAPLLPCDLHGTQNEPFQRGYFTVGAFGPLEPTLEQALPPGVIVCVVGRAQAPSWVQAALQTIVQLYAPDPPAVTGLVCSRSAEGGPAQIMAFTQHAGGPAAAETALEIDLAPPYSKAHLA